MGAGRAGMTLVGARARADAAAQARADVDAGKIQRRRRKAQRWTEKHPGQLRAIRLDLKAGDARRLSAEARRMLVLIAARPDVSRSRKWTTAKTARVTVDTDALRRHFHRWSASVARAAVTLKARLAAAELERQEKAFYGSLEAVMATEERGELRRYERASAPDPEAAYAILNDTLRDEQQAEARRWDTAKGHLSLRVLTGGSATE
jgi:hypothetical protein